MSFTNSKTLSCAALKLKLLSERQVCEAHIIYEWDQFRSAMNEMKTLRSIFPCLITAMTTTIKPAHLFDRKTSVLRTPVVIKGSIDRSNVEIHILPYIVLEELRMKTQKLTKNGSQ
jgi:hypothetical protein